MTTKTQCISADSHVVEPPELFAPLQARFGERAPRVQDYEDWGPTLNLGNGKRGIAIGNFLLANADFTSPQALIDRKRGYELARPGLYDIKARLEDQALDGVDAEVLYPSVLFHVYQIEDTEIVKATFSSYNDWLHDYCSEAPDRLFPLACVQLRDLDAAIAELERAKRMGFVGASIPCTATTEHPYTDPWYDKFWAAAEEMNMPLAMHIFTSATPNHGLPNELAGYGLAFAGVMFTIGDLIYSGVCERFPGLCFIPTEFETGWLGIFLNRIDWQYIRRGGARTHGIPRLPSEYWKQNFAITFEDDPIGIKTRDISGTSTLLWGNDYPHGDSIFPNSQRTLDRILADCTPAERYEMTVKNVVKLYDLPFEV